MTNQRDSGIDFNGDINLSSASYSPFYHEFSMEISSQHDSTCRDGFFQVNILKRKRGTQRNEAKVNPKGNKDFIVSFSKQENFVPYKDYLKKSVTEESEKKLSTFDMEIKVKEFIQKTKKESVFYPNFQYFEETLLKMENITNFREIIKQTLKNELRFARKNEIVSSSKSVEKLQGFQEKVKNESERCFSPDIFADYVQEDLWGVAGWNRNSNKFNGFSCHDQDKNDIQSRTQQLRKGLKLEIDQLEERNKQLISKIENFFKIMLEKLLDGSPLEIEVRNTNKWSNFDLIDNTLTLKPTGFSEEKRISFNSSRTRSKYSIIIYLLSEIYHLLETGSLCTLRELYYRDPELIENQVVVSNAIKDICCMLDAAPWELGILTLSKGLIAGSIQIILGNGDIVDCSNYPSGILIPQETSAIKCLKSPAKFVLIVEKDTVFESLLQQNILKAMGFEILLMTGKGFPDINTRVLLKKIWEMLRIPVYVLVDADPFGIEILLVYRYGSKAMGFNSDTLVCPKIRWIGIHPSEIELLAIPSMALNAKDKKRLSDLLQRSYLNDEIRNELIILQKLNQKAEIEGVSGFSTNFLTVDYIPSKIRRNFTI